MTAKFTLVPIDSISGMAMELETYDLVLEGRKGKHISRSLGSIRSWKCQGNGKVVWLLKSYYNWSLMNPKEHITLFDGMEFPSLDECLSYLAKHGYVERA